AAASAADAAATINRELQTLDSRAGQLNVSTATWVRASTQGFIEVMEAADPVAEAISRVRDAIRDANAEPVDLQARDAFGALVADLKKQE
ncbi:hypothetical protein, partial [Streptococcus pneumoniae]|uniref:hypothetical protein n=1 Tax=Streptococcus pneumoniae TaxID=1313 RepID=UPI0018B07AA3